MRIGELARRSGVSVHTVRFYERKGLLPRAARGPSNYREFPDQSVERLDLIRHAQALGFTLTEVREIVGARRLTTDCGELRRKGERKLAEVEQELQRLEAIKALLQKLLLACTAPADCSVSARILKLRPRGR
jgi:MerR family transcriptional regulator, copper efflux regulator